MAAVVLALVALAYLAPLLAGRQMGHGYLLYDYPPWQASKPPGFDVGGRNANLDVATQNLPFTEIARDQLGRGEAPLWNPYNYAGTPLLGDMQSALLYPLTWLGLLIGFKAAIGWMCVLKLFTAGFGTYLLARELRIRAGPSLVGALVYMLGAPIVAWLQTPLGTVLTLLPFLILTTERLRREPSVSRAAALAAVVALSIFAGHPETAALSSAAAAVYLVAAMWGRRAGEYLRALGGFIGAHALGVCAAAIVIIPFLSALQGSITAEVHGDHGAVHLPAGSGLVLFMPNVYGEGPEYRGPLFFYLSVTGYFGVAAMLFAVFGVWARRAEPYVRGLLAAAVVALMVIFSIPPVSWIVPHVPPYSGSLNVRVFHVVALAGAILAAAGLDAVLKERLPRRRIAFAAGGLLAVAGVWFTVQWLRDALPAPEGARALAVGKIVLFVGLGAAVLALVGRVRTRLVLRRGGRGGGARPGLHARLQPAAPGRAGQPARAAGGPLPRQPARAVSHQPDQADRALAERVPAQYDRALRPRGAAGLRLSAVGPLVALLLARAGRGGQAVAGVPRSGLRTAAGPGAHRAPADERALLRGASRGAAARPAPAAGVRRPRRDRLRGPRRAAARLPGAGYAPRPGPARAHGAGTVGPAP